MNDQRTTGNHATLARWLGLWSSEADQAALRAIHSDLARRYGEPHRHYHTLRHVSRCLQELDEARPQADHPLEVEVALWFHDAVYDPRSGDNEEASARYAQEALGSLIQGEPLNRVASLILATKHIDPPTSNDAKLTADIDLAVLGSSAKEYREYEDGIRLEYSWLPEVIFKAGRAEVLAWFLFRERIYHTDHFREKYEENARANLSRSISKLRASRPR